MKSAHLDKKPPQNLSGVKVHIKVRVFPDSAKEEIMRDGENSFKIFLREPAKQGLANKRLLKVLFGALDPSPKKMRIVTGEHSPSKVIEIQY